ncbi:vanillin dehydrogenase [Acinetobacter calcoaceticus]|uniref:Vanillin dehydrogenase n=1 Tax=Acinetobacter calcoaceticus TaxID=471 RepID=A0A4R1XY93_ACICA|nr:vanillin dehydrogenase [Acinetobacter calcoaceticus]
MHNVQLLINGQSRPASSGKTFKRISPLDGSVAAIVASASLDDVDHAIESAHRAFAEWSTLAPTERRARLLKAADLMEQRTAQFTQVGIQETGSTAAWYGFNVQLGANMLREAAAMTTQITGQLLPSDIRGNIAMGVRAPCGVVVAMAPWNAPIILAVRAIAMPLACGNTVVLKSSESSPTLHRMVAEILHESGIGNGVINVISHAAEDAAQVVSRLISHPLTKRVNFTGSTRVGKIVAQVAAQYLKPVLLELGGKSPVVILAQADLDAAVNAVVFGAFINQGQICMSTERVLVDEAISARFIEKLIDKTKTIHAGHPLTSAATLGLMESRRAAEHAHALLHDAQLKGALLPLGIQIQDTLMQPTLVINITPDMRLYTEESFAPICTIQRFNGEDEAVALANDSEFGLAAAVFSLDLAQAWSVANRIESGICHINGPTVQDEANMPFGGLKHSGYGRFGGQAAIAEFTELRWITMQTAPRHYPF